MSQQNRNKKKKCKKEPSVPEKYNNWNKKTLIGISIRLANTEEQISGLEDKLVELNQLEEQKEKIIFKNEDSLRDLCDNIKHSNIHTIGVPEGEDRKEYKLYLKK